MKKMRLFVFAALALAAILYVGCQDNNVVSPNVPALGNNSPEAVAKAIQTQESYIDQVMSIPGVVGCGLGLDDNGSLAIKVYTATATTSDAYAGKVASTYGGYPVVMEEIGQIYAMALTGRYRPVKIGVSCGNVTAGTACMAGTLGCIVNKSDGKYILSNNHVLARQNEASIGEDIHQPGSLDAKPQCTIVTADKVADLSDFVPISFGGNNNYDAAIAKFSITNINCATQTGYGFPGTSPVNATVGMRIQKVGRTTGLTTGTVSSINATVNVGYDAGTARFVGQIITSRRFCRSGDSGSLVVTNDTAKNPVALLFAGTQDGTSIVSPIAQILQRFNATMCGN